MEADAPVVNYYDAEIELRLSVVHNSVLQTLPAREGLKIGPMLARDHSNVPPFST